MINPTIKPPGMPGANQLPQQQARKPKAAGTNEADFSGEMMAAQAAGAPSSAVQLSAEAIKAADAVGSSRTQTGREASIAERTPATKFAAASLGAVPEITGSANPWGSAWVFQGEANPLENSTVRPLFGEPAQNALSLEGFTANPDLALTPELLAKLDQAVRASANQVQKIDGANSALGAQAAVADDAALMQQASFGGGVEVLSESGAAQARPAASLAGKISGEEFLATMNAASAARIAPDQAEAQGGAGDQGFAQGGQPRSLDSLAKPRARLGLPEGDAFAAQIGAAQAGLAPPAMAAAAGMRSAKPVPFEVPGHVTQGGGARDRLSSESLMGITSGIKSFSVGGANGSSGAGEMRVRLKPDNLGELSLHVRTNGSQVNLSIHALDERAKRIIEESINSLRDSLATQNLSLAKLEVAVSAAAAGGASGDQQQSMQQQGQGYPGSGNQAQFDLMQGQNGGRGYSEAWDAVEQNGQNTRAGASRAPGIATSQFAAANQQRSSSSRIDVRA